MSQGDKTKNDELKILKMAIKEWHNQKIDTRSSMENVIPITHKQHRDVTVPLYY